MRNTELTVKPLPSRASDQDFPFKVLSQQEAIFPIPWSWWGRETPLTEATRVHKLRFHIGEVTLGPPSPRGANPLSPVTSHEADKEEGWAPWA